MASPAAHKIAAAQQLLPDEILEDIFLLLESGADLARASASCRSFHRVTTGHRFLRRFLSLHPPPITGIISYEEKQGINALHPVKPPHQSAPAGSAIAQAGDFAFSFLPSDPNRSWILHDSLDGRFLLARPSTVDTIFQELVVCDPLYRRTCQNNGVGAEEWRHDKYLPLPEPNYSYSIIGAGEGYVLLSRAAPLERKFRKSLSNPTRVIRCSFVQKVKHFAVNLETLLIERLCMLNNNNIFHAHPYASFPPPFSLPRL